MKSQWKILDNGETLVGRGYYSIDVREAYKHADFISHVGEKMWVDPYDFFTAICQAFDMIGLEAKPRHDKAMRKALKSRADGIMYDVVAKRWRDKCRPDLNEGMFINIADMKSTEEMLADLYERV
jgi:hypothetical protein